MNSFPPRLLLAPAGHGKTEIILQHLRQALQAEPLAQVLVVVPNSIQAAGFRQRLSAAGGALGVEVHTFNTLYAELLGRAGQPMPLLTDAVRLRLLYAIVDALCEQGVIRHYAALRHKPGFIAALRNVIEELKRARIFPEAFAAAVHDMEARLGEIAAVYRAYQDWLHTQHWADHEGRGWLAAEVLESEARLGGDIRLLAVCGFDEFNPTQLGVLSLLARRAQETLIALSGDLQRPHRPAQQRFQRAQKALCASLGVQPESLDLEVKLAPALAEVEANLFEPAPSGGSGEWEVESGKWGVGKALLREGYAAVEKETPAIEFIEAQTRAVEARAALRWIKARLVRDGLALSEAALFARDLQVYRPFLEEAAAEFGIPLRIVAGLPLLENPAVDALIALLALPVEDWPRAGVLQAWRSPYFDWSATPPTPPTPPQPSPSLKAAMERESTPSHSPLPTPHSPPIVGLLDEVSRAGQVVKGLAQWREAFELARARCANTARSSLPRGTPDVAAEEEIAPLSTPHLLPAAQAAFESFVQCLAPPEPASLTEWIAFVENLIGDDPALPSDFSAEAPGLAIVACARANPATAERDVAALRALKDVLRGLALAESVVSASSTASLNRQGKHSLSIAALRDGDGRGRVGEHSLSIAALRDGEGRGRVGEHSLSIAALGDGEGRGGVSYADFFHTLRAALETASYSLPLQEGVMAASVLDGRGLSFQAAALLGLSEGEFPRQEREDILLRERDRAALRGRGLPLETRLHGDEATLFYQAVTRPRQKLLLTRPYLAEDGQPWEASPFWQEVHRLSGSPAARRVRPEDPLDPTEAASPVEWREAARQFDSHLQRGVEALQARLRPRPGGPYEGELFDLQARFPADYTWSASKLESYGSCPFEFLVAYGLELEPRQEPEEGFDVRALGSMLHAILEQFYAEAAPKSPAAPNPAALQPIAQAVFAAAPQQYGFRPTPLWELQQAELLRRLEESVAALEKVSQGWQPYRQELRFGLGAPELRLQTEAGPVSLHGFIDRLDIAANGSLRVMDYKTGSAPISAAHLRQGRRLQLPIYALAAQQALGLGQVTSGFYWHIQKGEASSLKLEKFEEGLEAALALATAHIGQHVSGIRAGLFPPRPPADGCPAYCPAVSFCWRYQKGF